MGEVVRDVGAVVQLVPEPVEGDHMAGLAHLRVG